MDFAIQTIGLTKIYNRGKRKEVVALQDASIEVSRGEILAVLGLNGAGKTTLIKILLGLTKMTSGKAFVLAEDVNTKGSKNRCKIGYLPESFATEKGTTVKELIRFMARIKGLKGEALKKVVDDVIEEYELKEIVNKDVTKLSKGTINRVGIAQAVLNGPEILFLDEPTDGLDIIWRKKIREKLLELKRKDVTIMLNSHLLSEVEVVADKVAIIHKGKILAVGKVSQLIPEAEGYQVIVNQNNEFAVDDKFVFRRDGDFSICVVRNSAELEELVRALNSKGIPVMSIEPVKPKLEDVFISYVSQKE